MSQYFWVVNKDNPIAMSLLQKLASSGPIRSGQMIPVTAEEIQVLHERVDFVPVKIPFSDESNLP